MAYAEFRDEHGYLVAKSTISFFERMIHDNRAAKHPTKKGLYIVNDDLTFQVPITGIKFFIWKGYTVEVIIGE